MALWKSQRENHTSDWLRTVPISRLGQTMNGKTYRCVLCYRLGIPLFSVLKPCSTCSRVFTRDIYGDHVVSCASIIGINHRHNVVRDTLVDICYRSGISVGKEVDIGLDGGVTTHYIQQICYFTCRMETGMADFVPGRAMINVAQRKRVKYMAKCAAIGYEFLPFSFSSFGELEDEAVTLLKRIRKFFMTQDIWARAAAHIFNRINFIIAKGEVDIWLDVGRDKPLRSADMLLYSWDGGLDVCVDLTRPSLLTRTGMVNFVPGRVVIDAAKHKRDKPLRPADMLLYSWDGRLDLYVDLTGSSPLTQTGMVYSVPGRAMIDDAQRKCGKYMAKCATIGYGFLPFSLSSLRELEAGAVTLLKRIRKFSMAQDIRARVVVHIFNRNSFIIAKGVGAQIISRLPTSVL
ncbi:hypothetical protein Tco_1279434 [Tanacetum coccineum]